MYLKMKQYEGPCNNVVNLVTSPRKFVIKYFTRYISLAVLMNWDVCRFLRMEYLIQSKSFIKLKIYGPYVRHV